MSDSHGAPVRKLVDFANLADAEPDLDVDLFDHCADHVPYGRKVGGFCQLCVRGCGHEKKNSLTSGLLNNKFTNGYTLFHRRSLSPDFRVVSFRCSAA